MNTLMKALMAGLISAGVGTIALTAYADEAGCHDKAAHRDFRHDRDFFAERIGQRKVKLYNELKLKPEQEAAWNTFIEKMKPTLPKERPDGAEFRKLPAPERLDKMLEMMKARESQMENRLAAVKDFYATLTPEQQKVFDDEFSLRFSRHSGPEWHHQGSGTGDPQPNEG